MKDIRSRVTGILGSRKGDSSVFQILVVITILTFFIFFPSVTFSRFRFENSADDITASAAHTASVRGAVDKETLDTIAGELYAKGYTFKGDSGTVNGDTVLGTQDGGNVIVWADTYSKEIADSGRIGGTYSGTFRSGTEDIPYQLDLREWEDRSTPNPAAEGNGSAQVTGRKFKTGYAFVLKDGKYTKQETGRMLNISIAYPVGAHTGLTNALTRLIMPSVKIPVTDTKETLPYYISSVTAVSELYQTSQIKQ